MMLNLSEYKQSGTSPGLRYREYNFKFTIYSMENNFKYFGKLSKKNSEMSIKPMWSFIE